MTPQQRQQLIAQGINPDQSQNPFTNAPSFGLPTAQPMGQPQQHMPQSPSGGGDIQAFIQGLQSLAAQSQHSQLQQQREALQPGRHLGMSGGVIDPTTNREAGNPFDNGFFQHKGGDFSGAYGPIDPAARAQTQQNMQQAFAQPTPEVQHLLPFTQAFQQPLPQNPGFASPQFPRYAQQVNNQQKNMANASAQENQMFSRRF